ncbi:sialidase family protein [Actinomadura sp. WMMB 499]|uniref:sialidase family protein n=1 Tax=Actinomadura sp. WMMB 499 TaxID=1219491 RepID=UPI00159E6450|nr:sialidase family protein [Actinomadura sp. WMMB 499]
MTATGTPDDDHQGGRTEAGQPEEAPPPPRWLNEGERPSGAEPLLPEPEPLPPFGTPLPEEPEQDTNRTVSDLDLSGMSTQIFKKDDEAAPAAGPPPLPPFPGADDEAGGGDAPGRTVNDPSAWSSESPESSAPGEPAGPAAGEGDATMIVDSDKTMHVGRQPPAPPTPPAPPAQPELPERPEWESPSGVTRAERPIEPETQQIASAQQPPAPPAPEPFPWAQEIPGTPAPQPPAQPHAQPPAPEPFPWAQEIPGTPPASAQPANGAAPHAPAPNPAPEPFPWAQEIPGTPTAQPPAQPPGPQPFPYAQDVPGANASPGLPGPAQPGPGGHAPPPPQIDEPWRTTPQQNAPKRKKSKKGLLIGVAGLAAVAIIAGGGYAVVTVLGGDEGPAGGGDARLAADAFPVAGSAQTDGRDQEFGGAAAVGQTVVTVGSETGAGATRGIFLVSTDGGRTFKSATVEGPAGSATPQAVAGGPSGWVAIGAGATGGAVWTSADGQSWTRQPDAVGGVFNGGYRVDRVVATGAGYVAIGAQSAKGDFSDEQPTVWLSSDGRAWEARTGDQIGLNIEKASYSLVEVAASGDVVLLEGLIKPDNKKPPQYRKVWRSQDAGRTWATSEVPVPKGSRGLIIGGGQAGFLAVREMKDGDAMFGQTFVSKDGENWTKAGKLEAEEYRSTSRIIGDEAGYTALVARGGDVLLSRSANGGTWKAAGTAPAKPGREVTGAAAANGQTVMVGREPGGGDMDPMLAVWDANGQQVPIDLAKVPGAIRPDHAVQAVAGSGSLAVAVGSGSGDAAVWTSADGAAWKAAQGLGAAFTRPGPQRLLDVATGKSGWVAVGYDQTAPKRALVVTSQDGATWQAADSAAPFRPDGDGAPATSAVAAGSAGYVVVGTQGYHAAAWSSTDLKNWEKGTGADASALQGTSDAFKWMLDVAAPTSGYVAAGGHRDAQGNHPAVWSSPDGKQWTLKSLPVPSGVSEAHLTHIAAKGDTLVAAGIAAMQEGLVWIGYTSADGGKTWQDLPAPGGDQKITVTALTATADGFAGSATSAAEGSADVVSLTSKDGTAWEATKPGGTGLGGDGDQAITGLTTFKEKVLGVGHSGDANGTQPVLWER